MPICLILWGKILQGWGCMMLSWKLSVKSRSQGAKDFLRHPGFLKRRIWIRSHRLSHWGMWRRGMELLRSRGCQWALLSITVDIKNGGSVREGGYQKLPGLIIKSRSWSSANSRLGLPLGISGRSLGSKEKALMSQGYCPRLRAVARLVGLENKERPRDQGIDLRSTRSSMILTFPEKRKAANHHQKFTKLMQSSRFTSTLEARNSHSQELLASLGPVLRSQPLRTRTWNPQRENGTRAPALELMTKMFLGMKNNWENQKALNLERSLGLLI